MVVYRCKRCRRIADGLQEVGLHCGLKDKFIAENRVSQGKPKSGLLYQYLREVVL